MLARAQEFIIQCDYIAWYYLNTVWRHPLLDLIIPFFRNQWTWVPLYLFLLVFMLLNFGRRGVIWCLFFILTFALSDQISAHLMKPIFMRVRPCNDLSLAAMVQSIVECGSGYSFPSSHAANHFALAVFMGSTLKGRVRWIWPVVLLWAFLISYAQVYVGVHFPLDVICGGVIGVLAGMLTARLFRWKFGLAAVSVS